MISFVIPIFNEEKNLVTLYEEITLVMQNIKQTYEIIFSNDGSTDGSFHLIAQLHKKDKRVKAIHLRHQSGKAAALHAGFQMAKGTIIITLDGDLQDDPREISRMLSTLKKGYDLVSGWKLDRKDSFVKNTTSKLFNAATNIISPVKLHDFNCGFKAYTSEAAKGLNLYGELHRYIPVLVSMQGYRVTEIPVHHRKRIHGKSKYGPLRFLHGFFDLITVFFITRFHVRPLHLFGYLGVLFFTLGFLAALYLTSVKFFFHESIGQRPLLLLSVMLMIMGVQIGVTGLVGEQIANMQNRNMNNYDIRNILR